jgi:hypothetical protein
MTPREMLALALRVLGFWVLIYAVGNMAWLVATFTRGGASSWEFVSPVIGILGYSAVTACFLLFAPWIASWFYGQEAVRPTSGVTAGEIYEISAKLLGVYSFLSAIPSASKILVELIAPSAWLVRWENINRQAVIEFTAYFIAGVLLIVGSKRIRAMFATDTPL